MSALADTNPELRSTRDDAALRERLRAWFARTLPASAAPQVGELSSPGGSGMSSETLLFDLAWREEGREQRGAFVARMAPAQSDVPVFPRYDLALQARVMKLVRAHGVPAPVVRWLELDATPLGAPFIVMERLEGRVPRDIPPYLIEGWLFDATLAEQRRLQDATVEMLARLHAVAPARAELEFLEFKTAGATPLARHLNEQRAYFEWVAQGERHPLLERTFDYLTQHFPRESAPVISWGDARIGNVMYEGFAPRAVLDWEMAGIGPREIDIAWMIFIHMFFVDLFARMNVPVGLPDFLRPEDVVACYERASGETVRDLRWYIIYAALRHGIVMTRIAARMHHFGQAERAADPDARFPHSALLKSLLAGDGGGGA